MTRTEIVTLCGTSLLYLAPTWGGYDCASCVAVQRGRIQVWVKAMANQYSVQANLGRIFKTTSAECPFCHASREPLARFACVFLQFRKARTAAHKQLRKVISSLLVKYLLDYWELHEETPMANIGLL